MIPYLLVVLLCAFASSAEVPTLTPYDYHKQVGIPLASKIKKAEFDLVYRNRANRIINGVNSAPNHHPYFGALLIDFVNSPGSSVCGSTLLSQNRLVTAAHCWWNGELQASRFTVVLETTFLYFGGQRVVTSNVIMHPQWNTTTLNNDIAMIYLPVNLILTNTLQPMALPNFSQLSENFVGQWGVAVGFGTTSDQQNVASTVMSEVNLQVIPEAQCVWSFGSTFVIHSTMCTSGAGFVGVCGGDSGGPLYITRNGQKILIGISSFAAELQCENGHPSGFARVTSFYNFIVSHLF